MSESGTEQSAPSKVIDILFGVAVMGTVGMLIGFIMGGGIMPLASGAGLVLGGVIGFMGGRRFLVSILVGTLLAGRSPGLLPVRREFPWARGPAPPWVDFSVYRSRCCWICARQRKLHLNVPILPCHAQSKEHETRWKIGEYSSGRSSLSLGASS